MSTDVLLIFARFPTPGSCKTRLAPALGIDGAAEMHRRLVEHTFVMARTLRDHGVSIDVRFTGGSAEQLANAFGHDLDLRPQHGEDLGERLNNAFADAFETGARRVIAIGTDCPELFASDVQAAFRQLDSHEVVLGPARDGGYYLIGNRRHRPHLFQNIAWGTGTVTSETIERIHAAGVAAALLSMKSDVDRPDDLPQLYALDRRTADDSTRPRVSAVVPVLNHEPRLAELLRITSAAPGVETIVVASGSAGHSLSAAARFGARLLCSSPSRAAQMNLGAAQANAETLLFAHADTLLPDQFADDVEQVLMERDVVAGAFTLSIDGVGWPLRLIEAGVSMRSKWLQFPYGDQALFLRRSTFESLGGFPTLPLMEDYELVRRLRRLGRIRVCDARIHSSARRWRALGAWRTTFVNQCIIAGYHLGVPLETLAGWYGPRRRQKDVHAAKEKESSLGAREIDPRPDSAGIPLACYPVAMRQQSSILEDSQ